MGKIPHMLDLMIARVIKTGSSQELLIPKLILDQTGITENVEMEIGKNRMFIRPVENVREGLG